MRYLTGRGVFHIRSQCEAASCEVVIVTQASDRPSVFVPPYHVGFWKERVSIVEPHPSTDMIQFLEAPKRANVRSAELSSNTPGRMTEQVQSILKQASFHLDGSTISESRLQKSAREEAKEKVRKILKERQVPALPKETTDQMEQILSRASQTMIKK